MQVYAKGPSPSHLGPLGLNTIPDARMDAPGTVRVQASIARPYTHGSLGLQIARPLYIALHQTTETGGSPLRHADRLYPGIDLKILLLSETARRPAVALGLQSAAGQKRTAGEYLVLSKRFGDFDVTGGIGWGRMAGRNRIGNPLKPLLGHFGKNRTFDDEQANGPGDWFTGNNVGLFGGVAWDTPHEGLTLKADWNADSFAAEQSRPDFDTPQPWSVGFSYSPRDWITLGAAFAGGNAIYGSLSFQAPIGRWPGRAGKTEKPQPYPPYRSGSGSPAAIDSDAAEQDMKLRSVFDDDGHTVASRLLLTPDSSLPQQAGRAVRSMARYGGRNAETFEIRPALLGLEGPSIRLMPRDLEQTMARENGSPQEIWRHTEINVTDGTTIPDHLDMQPTAYTVALDSKTSLSEDDQGLLYRTGLIVEGRRMLTRHLLTGQGVRLNLANNLKHLNDFRLQPLLPVRSDEDAFAARGIAVDRSYISWMQSLNTDWHYALTAGYLEEMYAGFGGEILYRPFGRTFAFGAEVWEALKRDPAIPFNLGVNGDHLLTGHLKAWYEIPGTDLTLQARVGRYLAEDIGGTLSLTNAFRNGASLEAFVTATNRSDINIFGGESNLASGLRLRLPIGNIPLVPDGSVARQTAAPFGRDSGQSIDNPLPLYDLTTPLSYRAITENWGDIVK